jgi:hypothetical protein
MPDPAQRRPAWLDGLAPDGVVLHATMVRTTDGLYLTGIAGFGALFVILTFLRNGNLLVAGAIGAAAVVIGAVGLKSVREGVRRMPVLAYDAGGLYLPGAGLIRWADIRHFRLLRTRRSVNVALELEPARRARLSTLTRLQARMGQGDMTIAGAILPVSVKGLLDALDPHYHGATGRHVPH